MKRSSAKLASSPDDGPILLYDGFCALCNGWVSFLLRIDPAGSLRFAALSGTTGQQLIARHPELGNSDSLIVIEGLRGSARSTAVLRIVRYLGGAWRVLLVGYLIPREIRDSLYDVIAYWRYRIGGRYDTCPAPPPASKARFLP